MNNLTYTKDQRRAIEHRKGNLLILACAGSGKTEVISYRIASLVREGILKSGIIAFTFTERAARELKLRIRQHLEELLPENPALGDMYVGTIHSFCLKLIREVNPRYRSYEVMDEARQMALIMTNYSNIGLDRLRPRTRTGSYFDTLQVFLNTLNVIHQKDLQLTDISDAELREAVDRYRRIAYDRPNLFFDYNSIIDKLLSFLTHNSKVLKELHKRFQHLVVDEYQDVDDRQEELIRLLTDSGKQVQVTVVGDDDQAIYGWRGAQINNILSFDSVYPDVTRITLKENFRSTHAVVDVANKAIRSIPANRRIKKAMIATYLDRSSAPPRHKETMAEKADIQLRKFETEEEEARWVARRIEQLLGTIIREKDGNERGLHYGDIAILLRSVKSSGRVFADVLRDEGLPVVVKGTGGLFDHAEVQVVQAVFCLLARCYFNYDAGQGPQRLDEPEIREFIRHEVGTLKRSKLMPKADASVLLEWVAAKREELDRRNLEKADRGRLARRIYPQEIFKEILNTLGAAAGPEPWHQDILFNLGRLSTLITHFEAVHQWITPRDLVSLCMFLGGWAVGRVDEGGLDELVTPNAVQILTIHAAKGLEWPVVFIPRVSSHNFPSSYRNRGPETFLGRGIFDARSYASGDEGELRLWYVALTRCRKFLNITSIDRKKKRPTMLFTEIQHDYVQRKDPIAERPKGKPAVPSNVEILPTTYSDLSCYWRCQFEYQLRSLMGFGPGVTESYGYGQQIHNVLAEVHKKALDGEILSEAEVMQLVDERFHLRYTRDGTVFKPFTMLRDAAKKSLGRYLKEYADTAKYVLDAEKAFEFVDKGSGALISGTIDLLQRVKKAADGSQELLPVGIVDFKTHRWTNLDRYVERKAEVESQLRLYAVAVRQALGRRAKKAVAHFLSPNSVPPDQLAQGVVEKIRVDISQQRQEEVQQEVKKAVKGIRASIASGKFKLTGCENRKCDKCDFREICPGYQHWRRRDRTTPTPPSFEDAQAEEMAYVVEDVDAR